MIRALYTSISGLITQEAKQKTITNNIANANTIGFKGDNLSIKKFDDVLIQNYDKMVGGKNVRNVIGSLSLGSKVDETNTDYTPGMIQDTGKTTDFALEDRGFFVVRYTDGVTQRDLYTRDGHFHVNGEGYLVNDSGAYVLAQNKATNNLDRIYVGRGEITCDPSGNLDISGNNAYRLAIVDFNNYAALEKVGNNCYTAPGAVAANTTVRQNSLEKSNVNVINEMVNMITVMRTFETNQKVVQSIDETLGKAVNEIGTIR